MRTILFVFLMATLTLAGGCRQDETATTTPEQTAESASAELTPEQLGELGAQIKKEPNRAQEILAAHGLNEQSFEEKIRQITEDPEASRRYTAAFNRASA